MLGQDIEWKTQKRVGREIDTVLGTREHTIEEPVDLTPDRAISQQAVMGRERCVNSPFG